MNPDGDGKNTSIGRRTFVDALVKGSIAGNVLYGTYNAAKTIPWMELADRNTELEQGFLEDQNDPDSKLSPLGITLLSIPTVTVGKSIASVNPHYAAHTNEDFINLLKPQGKPIDPAPFLALYYLDYKGIQVRAEATPVKEYGMYIDPRIHPIHGSTIKDISIAPDYSVQLGTLTGTLMDYQKDAFIAFRVRVSRYTSRLNGLSDIYASLREAGSATTTAPLIPPDQIVLIDLTDTNGAQSGNNSDAIRVRGHRVLMGDATAVIQTLAPGRNTQDFQQILSSNPASLFPLTNRHIAYVDTPVSAEIWEHACLKNGITWQGDKPKRTTTPPQSFIAISVNALRGFNNRVGSHSLSWQFFQGAAVVHTQHISLMVTEPEPNIDEVYSLVSLKRMTDIAADHPS